MFFRMMWLKNRLGVAFGGGVNTLKHWQQPLVLKVLRMNLNKIWLHNVSEMVLFYNAIEANNEIGKDLDLSI